MSEALSHTLAALVALLTSEGYSAHAEEVERARQTLGASEQETCHILASNAFWGGPGAIWEISFSKEWQPGGIDQQLSQDLRNRNDAEVSASNRQLATLIVSLSQEFSQHCAHHVDPTWIERASFLGRTMQRFLDEDRLP
jgi:hypothetical protein